MTRTKFVFSYTELSDFSHPTEITMEMPERVIDEMCEYFQRFLTAAGYIFDEGETIRCVPRKINTPDYQGRLNDILFNTSDGFYPYTSSDPKDHIPVDFNSGVRGGMADDIIKL
jgi:hypothetical protein